MDNKNSNKTASIDNSLTQASRSLEVLKKELTTETKQLPADARHMEKRIRELQQELETISSGILAYKLRRLAESKMLESVSELASETLPIRKKVKDSPVKKETHGANKEGYQSTTFKCKSDLDQCLTESANAIDKALCYALFIRCAVKG